MIYYPELKKQSSEKKLRNTILKNVTNVMNMTSFFNMKPEEFIVMRD